MKKRRYLILFVTFLLGFGSALLFGAVAIFYDLALSPEERLVEQWKLYQGESGRLRVQLPKDGIFVEIVHKPGSDRLQSIDIMKEEVGSIFEYKVAGELGTPLVRYSAGPFGEWKIWTDLNADGYFDERIIGKKKLEVFIDNQWVRAKKAVDRSAHTDRGIFEFDTNKGKWIIVPPEKSIQDEK